MLTRSRLIFLAALAIAFLATAPWGSPSHAAEPAPEPFQLITPEEADQPVNTAVGRRAGPIDDGPAIQIASPASGEALGSPVAIHVIFAPGKSGLPVDMSSLKLEYQRAWGIDITSRVRKFIEGQELRISEASLPEGRHAVEITIRDTADNLSARTFAVVVSE